MPLYGSHWVIALGHITITPGAARALSGSSLPFFLRRHALGDWGDLDAEDKATNNRHARQGGRVLSQYKINPDLTIWIITEADRSTTTVLLPGEY